MAPNFVMALVHFMSSENVLTFPPVLLVVELAGGHGSEPSIYVVQNDMYVFTL